MSDFPKWELVARSKTTGYRHRLSPGFGHALMTPIVAGVFAALRVTASIEKQGSWWAIHRELTLGGFESEHGVESARYAYNGKHLSHVRRHKAAVRGQHLGYHDSFVPILAGGQLISTLVVGPYALERPTSADVLERWRKITGRQGHPADPEFAAYLSASVSTLVLEGSQITLFDELLECTARLLGSEGEADELANRAEKIRVELERVRLVETTWEAVNTMLDDRTSHVWWSAHNAHELARLGLSRIPDHVLVGLASSAASGADPVDEALRLNAFQRSSVELARSIGDVLSGRVGEHGVVFLSTSTGAAARKKQKVLELSERASTLARRRFDLSLHFGASVVPRPASLGRNFQHALAAAEAALVQGVRRIDTAPDQKALTQSLRELRRGLEQAVDKRPELLSAQFDRYLEVVAFRHGYRADVARGHLEAGFERLSEPLLARGALDEKSFGALCEQLDRATETSLSVGDLFTAYRHAVADLTRAVQEPLAASHDRSLRRAVDYIHQHYAEDLDVERVARIAGFAPNYFSKLFKQRERRAFADYVSGLRVERAKQLLTATKLEVRRIAELSGFRSAQYFSRVFHEAVHCTPLQYREKAGVRSLPPGVAGSVPPPRKAPKKPPAKRKR